MNDGVVVSATTLLCSVIPAKYFESNSFHFLCVFSLLTTAPQSTSHTAHNPICSFKSINAYLKSPTMQDVHAINTLTF